MKAHHLLLAALDWGLSISSKFASAFPLFLPLQEVMMPWAKSSLEL